MYKHSVNKFLAEVQDTWKIGNDITMSGRKRFPDDVVTIQTQERKTPTRRENVTVIVSTAKKWWDGFGIETVFYETPVNSAARFVTTVETCPVT